MKGIPATSGADRVVECLVDDLSRTYDLTVYCKKGYADNGRFYKNIGRIFIPTIPKKNLDMFLYFLLSAFHACFIRRFDLVHVHNIDCAYILPLLRLIYRSKIISTSHGSPYEREKWSSTVKKFFRYLEKKFIRYSPYITVVAEPLQTYYHKKYGAKTEYIPNGVAPDPGDKSCSVAEKQEYILFAAGRILPSKGCHIFLQAMKHFNYPGKLLVIGDLNQMPDYSAELRRMAPVNTLFIGFINSKDELMQYIKKSKIFVFPSTYEAASMMLLEAVSMGVPSVVSDIPENVALLKSDSAVFFKTGNADDLKTQIKLILTDYDHAVKRAQKLRHYVLNEYSWSKIAQSYMLLYNKIINN